MKEQLIVYFYSLLLLRGKTFLQVIGQELELSSHLNK